MADLCANVRLAVYHKALETASPGPARYEVPPPGPTTRPVPVGRARRPPLSAPSPTPGPAAYTPIPTTLLHRTQVLRGVPTFAFTTAASRGAPGAGLLSGGATAGAAPAGAGAAPVAGTAGAASPGPARYTVAPAAATVRRAAPRAVFARTERSQRTVVGATLPPVANPGPGEYNPRLPPPIQGGWTMRAR